MRLSVHLQLESSQAGLLPLDYRQGIASLLKAALKRYAPATYRTLYREGQEKPFTFAVYFPRLAKDPLVEGDVSERRYLRVGSVAIWNLSFADLALGAEVANVLVRFARRLQPHTWRQQWAFAIQRVLLQPYRQAIHSERVRFRTLSPFLVNARGASHRYLTPASEGFLEGLQFLVGELSTQFLGQRFELNWEGCDFSELQAQPVWHYRQYMTSNRGHFTLAGPPALLHLLYRAGIGARRSQGFGMLEIVEEI
ncbi:MAG: CRISPR-associated endoribonuclease Cas6 [Bacteroidia bacterium]|nr:CRISPR-associated endoribonuclease Cas6 [Bacteroidia bacterium]